MFKEDAKPIPDKVQKPETIDTDSKTPETKSVGEFTDQAKDAMKSFYGDDAEITDENFGYKMEEMIATGYVPMKKQNDEFMAVDKNVKAMMNDNPALAGVMSEVGQGARADQVLNKYYDLEALMDAEAGDPEMYAENNKYRMENYDNIQTRKKLIDENEKKSLETVKRFMADKKLEGDNADAFGKYIAKVIDLANSGDLTEEFLEGMYHAMNYKKDVEDAATVATVAAKNEKIEEITKSEAELQKGDSLPVISSADEPVDNTTDSDEFADRLGASLDRKKSVYR